MPGGWRLERHESLPSTMDRARALAEAGERGDLVVWAGQQTAGRGRQGRSWVSPPGNLYATLLLRPAGPPAAAARLGFAAGLALADAASAWIAPERVTLKWPNDLMLDGAKAAGILLEASGRAERVDWLMIGSGVNLASHPEGLDYPVASFAGAGAAVTPGELLQSYVKFFDIYRNLLMAQGFSPLRHAWMKRAQGLGQRMTARLPGASHSGIFRDLDEDGALVLEEGPGRRRRITAAEVYFG
ncbi:MAG TPA: biotin--[acetyl-CoA-carboxylase] ligase [Kiloniellales bacterium]|nr:biotin--[acetyl-CoA-carboxylase] ligase [Kiloniellales bacterium]